MRTKFLFGVTSLLLFGGVSLAVQHPPRSERGAATGARTAQQDGGRFHRLREMARRLRHGREFARSLGITQAQREQAKEVAKSLKPLAEEVRPQARDILERARALKQSGDREGARALLQSELRPLVERARASARPLVQPLIGSMTPDQRAKLEAAARRHGRTLDEGRLAERLALRLARRRAK